MPQVVTEAQKEKRRAANRRWYQRNLEAQRLRGRIKGAKEYSERRDVILHRNARWRSANIEKFRAKDRRYRQNNLEKKKAQVRAYHQARANDPEFKRQKSLSGKRNYLANKEKILARHRQWIVDHPGIQRVYSQRRRALEKAATINNSNIKEWMLKVKKKAFAACYYCNAIVSTRRIHFEHIVPLSRGGPHSVENLCVSCKLCNLQKGTRRLSEWDKDGQQVMNL